MHLTEFCPLSERDRNLLLARVNGDGQRCPHLIRFCLPGGLDMDPFRKEQLLCARLNRSREMFLAVRPRKTRRICQSICAPTLRELPQTREYPQLKRAHLCHPRIDCVWSLAWCQEYGTKRTGTMHRGLLFAFIGKEIAARVRRGAWLHWSCGDGIRIGADQARAELPMSRVRARRNLQLALQDESRMPAMPRDFLEGSRRVARRDVPRLRGGVLLVPGELAVPRVRDSGLRHRADFYSLHDRRRQRAAVLPAHAERMDGAGLSVRRHRASAVARDSRAQESFLIASRRQESLRAAWLRMP